MNPSKNNDQLFYNMYMYILNASSLFLPGCEIEVRRTSPRHLHRRAGKLRHRTRADVAPVRPGQTFVCSAGNTVRCCACPRKINASPVRVYHTGSKPNNWRVESRTVVVEGDDHTVSMRLDKSKSLASSCQAKIACRANQPSHQPHASHMLNLRLHTLQSKASLYS